MKTFNLISFWKNSGPWQNEVDEGQLSVELGTSDLRPQNSPPWWRRQCWSDPLSVCDTEQEKMRSPSLRLEIAAFSATGCYTVPSLLQSTFSSTGCYMVLQGATWCFRVPSLLTSWQALSSDTGPAPEKEWTCQGRGKIQEWTIQMIKKGLLLKKGTK